MVCSHWYYKARDKFLLTSESAIRRIQDQERGTVLDSAVVCRGLSQDTKIVLWLRYVMCTFGQRWLPWLELVLRSQWRKVGFPWVQETERTKPLIPVSEQNSARGSDSVNIYQGHRWRRKFSRWTEGARERAWLGKVKVQGRIQRWRKAFLAQGWLIVTVSVLC